MIKNPAEESSEISLALKRDKIVDISTRGRKSGQWRRIEIWFHTIDGRIYLTAIPRPRGWFANLLANPEFHFHLKESVQADLNAKARSILDPDERQEILGSQNLRWYHQRSGSKEAFVLNAPLIEVTFV